MSSDLRVITCYFNPCRYRTKRHNFDRFMEGMKRNGANVLVVELAFGDEEFELTPSEGVLQLRGNGVMWQKERLLNIAAATLPASCCKIAWLDCDLLFQNPDWVQETSLALDKYMVVQPYARVVRLPRGQETFDGRGDSYESMGLVFSRTPKVARESLFARHGHTGFAWAARRELFDQIGLYDVCLTGSGDHLMAHGFAGGLVQTPCLKVSMAPQGTYLRHYLDWACKARDLVMGRFGFVHGDLLHLWHGDFVNRRYEQLGIEFGAFDFDPTKDLRRDGSDLWEWADAPQRMRDWASELFWLRREDGEQTDEQPVAAADD